MSAQATAVSAKAALVPPLLISSNLSISDAHVLAVLAGVFFGCAAISTACWVWLRKQIFAFGGSALCGSGVVLLGLPIWHSVEFGVSGTSISLKLQAALEQQCKEVDLSSPHRGD